MSDMSVTSSCRWTSTRWKLEDLADQHGWAVLNRGVRSKVWYRWHGGIRVEVHVVFDRAGRVEAWSVWNNHRVTAPDHEAGRADRLLQMMAVGDA